MRWRFMPLIIVILLLILIAIGAIGVKLLVFNENEGSVNEQMEYSEKPIIKLDKEVDEEKGKISIKVSATTKDGTSIKQIVLPNGKTIMGSSTTFEANENGDYAFTVYNEKGISNTEIINISELKEISATNPYIPEGFSAVGGSPITGYVIEDEYGNQYVWVPVEDGKLTRVRMSKNEYQETSEAATELVNSVAKYYGFYIARFEASEYEIDGKIVAASMAGKTPWFNITCTDAIKKASESAKAFGYEGYSTALISSYAWDTTLEWIDNSVTNYSSSIDYGNYTGTIYPTGYTEKDNINNICDLAGNVREWTTEIYKESEEDSNSSISRNTEEIKNRVVRGGSASSQRVPMAYTGYAENTYDSYWGFRMVLYK